LTKTQYQKLTKIDGRSFARSFARSFEAGGRQMGATSGRYSRAMLWVCAQQYG
jgi:hypothetical protein